MASASGRMAAAVNVPSKASVLYGRRSGANVEWERMRAPGSVDKTMWLARRIDRPVRKGAAGIATELGYHSFRATGITVYMQKDGSLKHAHQMAEHESAHTTKLYNRRGDKATFDSGAHRAVI